MVLIANMMLSDLLITHRKKIKFSRSLISPREVEVVENKSIFRLNEWPSVWPVSDDAANVLKIYLTYTSTQGKSDSLEREVPFHPSPHLSGTYIPCKSSPGEAR